MIQLGKKDTITKDYMSNPVIFADAFNKYLYHGKTVILPEQLKELDTTEIIIPYGADGASVPEQKYRDVLKLLMAMTDGKNAYCILGIENQSDIHYAMPVKNGIYDFMQLAHQVSEAAKSHRAALANGISDGESKPTPDEYLSGFWKTDKLIPVVTLVIYFGADEWDAPLSLKEMYENQDSTILEHAADYRVNLISPEGLTEEDINEFKTNLREIMLYIKYSKDKEKLNAIVTTDDKFRNVDRQAADLINIVTSSKFKYPEGKETVDMCVAIEEMRKESELKGELRGELKGAIKATIEMCKEFGKSQTEAIEKVIQKFGISEDDADSYVEEFWN